MTRRDLFPGFETCHIAFPSGNMFARIGGTGPALLLLHGYPQTHVCWHRVASVLAREFRLVIPDLRGYGASHCPPGDPKHENYSKRVMGDEMCDLMRALGHSAFMVVGHDRGARVAYRMALDHPDHVRAVAPLDILPTSEVWRRITAESARGGYHWQFLSQPHPLPETLIGGAPTYYVQHTLASWTRDRTLGCFDPAALEHYESMLDQPERIHAVCEDYRAGATIDRAIDEADFAAGRCIEQAAYIVWGSDYIGKGAAQPLDVWRRWAPGVKGVEIRSGHFLAEENPDDLIAALLPFLRGASRHA